VLETRRRDEAQLLRLRRIGLHHGYQPIAVLKRQRLDQHRVDDRKHRGRRRDAERQRRDGSERKGRPSDQRATGNGPGGHVRGPPSDESEREASAGCLVLRRMSAPERWLQLPTRQIRSERDRMHAVFARLRSHNAWTLFAALPRADRPLATLWWVLLILRGV